MVPMKKALAGDGTLCTTAECFSRFQKVLLNEMFVVVSLRAMHIIKYESFSLSFFVESES